jgi:hypothetical protein
MEKNKKKGACGMCDGQERCIQGLVEKPEGKGPLGRPERRCEDNIEKDFHEVGWGGAWSRSISIRMGTGGRML